MITIQTCISVQSMGKAKIKHNRNGSLFTHWVCAGVDFQMIFTVSQNQTTDDFSLKVDSENHELLYPSVGH